MKPETVNKTVLVWLEGNTLTRRVGKVVTHVFESETPITREMVTAVRNEPDETGREA